MKTLNKMIVLAVFLSLAFAVCAYAEEVKTEEAAVPSATVSEPVAVPAASEAAKIPEVVPEPIAPAVVGKTTLDNLQAAFNGESNANAKYLAFAQKADEEGYGKVASLFRAAARAEQIHFERHAEIIKKMGATPTANIQAPVLKTTAENLQDAINGETYETTTMYPEFLAKAELDKDEDSTDAFEDAGKAEAVHASLYKEALANLKSWKGKNKNFYVCPFCGNVVERANFQFCPICGETKKKFIDVK